MKKALLFLNCILLLTFSVFAQQPTTTPPQGQGQKPPQNQKPPQGQQPPQFGGGQMPAGMKMPQIGRVYGKILEAKTKQPVPYASVVVVPTFSRKDTVVGGALTQENGEFSIGELPFGPLTVKIRYVGFKEFTQKLMVTPPDNVEIDLGDIKLESDAKVLNEVEVTAQKSQMQLNLDKKVFNVDKNITATGGTAEDVLKNVPSVTVNADGNAQLRNQNTTIFVDGRPTPLSINQIPADQIENIEVITNPSAKYDASTTGGIINIVLKKNRKPGINGFLSLSAGFPLNYNGTLNLNVKQGPVNVSGFYSINGANNPIETYTNITNRNNFVPTDYFDQVSDNTFNRQFQIGRLSLDYSINNRNTLTLAGTIVRGRFNIKADQDILAYNPLRVNTLTGTFGSEARNRFNNYNGQLLWKKAYPKKGKELTSDLTYGFGGSTNEADWRTDTISPTKGNRVQENRGGSDGYQLTYQLDFVNPINDSNKLEMGLRALLSDRDQDLAANIVLGINGSRELIPIKAQSNNANLKESIYAAYMTYTGKIVGIGYQAGLRYEQSRLDGTSRLDNNATFGYNYPGSLDNIFNALFPSLFLTKKINAKTDVQFNISRKIDRPGFFNLLPIIREATPVSYTIGNQALKPAFINLMELNYNKLFGNSNWLISLYLRNEQDPILGFIDIDAAGLQRTTFINAKTANRYGVDNTLKLGFGKNVDLTTNVNIFNLIVRTSELEKNGIAGIGKLILNWKLPKDYSIQWTNNYESNQVLPQGERRGIYAMDFAVKKTFFRVASLTFSVNDIFNSRKQITIFDTPFLLQEGMRRRDIRNFRIAFQMPFGKMDASIFKRRGQGQRQGGGQQDIDL